MQLLIKILNIPESDAKDFRSNNRNSGMHDIKESNEMLLNELMFIIFITFAGRLR
jgi:hypothetical protein